MSEKIFISYNHKDSDIVDMVSRRLAIEFGQKNIFYDAWSIRPGDSIVGKMNQGLGDFTVFFFFVSPNSLNSKFVSLEWQSALNRAVSNDLKFVAIRITNCDMPAILCDKLYVDLYEEGLDSAIEKMKCIVKSKSTYQPLEDVQNLVVSATRIDEKTLRFTIEAKKYIEANPEIAFACSNSFEDFSVCFNISDSFTIQRSDGIIVEDALFLNARIVQMQRPLRPGYPFVFNVYLEKTSRLRDIFVFKLVNAVEGKCNSIPILWETPQTR